MKLPITITITEEEEMPTKDNIQIVPLDIEIMGTQTEMNWTTIEEREEN